jgi:hypothetical protein
LWRIGVVLMAAPDSHGGPPFQGWEVSSMVKGWVWFGECRHGHGGSRKTSRTRTRTSTHKGSRKNCQ